MDSQPPPTLDYRARRPTAPGGQPRWSVWVYMVAWLCWVPTGLTLALWAVQSVYRADPEAAYLDTLLATLIALPLLSAGGALLMTDVPEDPKRGMTFLMTSVATLFLGLTARWAALFS